MLLSAAGRGWPELTWVFGMTCFEETPTDSGRGRSMARPPYLATFSMVVTSCACRDVSSGGAVSFIQWSSPPILGY